MPKIIRLHSFLWLLLHLSFAFSDVPYEIHVEGLEDKNLLEVLRSVSQIYSLQDHPPPTTTALRRRAEGDAGNFLIGFQSRGYYSPTIEIEVDPTETPASVNLKLEKGPIYTLGNVTILADPEDPKIFYYEGIDLACLGIIENQVIFPHQIIDAETALEQTLKASGYPLAEVTNKEVVANGESHTIEIHFKVNSGPLAYFGYTTMVGNRTVDEAFFRKKITWKPGELYDYCKLEETKGLLEGSGLFSSVTIHTEDELSEDGTLPVEIRVIEGKHHTIGLGASYNTQLGGGVTLEWQNRNVRNIGEVFSFEGDVWFEKQKAAFLYRQPDFICRDQDLLWIAEGEREKTSGFDEKFIKLSSLIDRRWGCNTRLSYGISFKQLQSDDSVNDGSYTLLKLPLQIRWSNANHLLDPTCGVSIQTKLTPTFQLIDPQFTYFIHTTIASVYFPLGWNDIFVLAGKATWGNIFGASSMTVPTPELFFAGSENTLRGYRYKTVSPLNTANKPVGGRSLFASALELRIRVSECIGWVLFYEVGNVFSTIFPDFKQRQRQSAGVGFRYHTPVGPLRIDAGIPLNPRKGIDREFELYFSIGQAF